LDLQRVIAANGPIYSGSAVPKMARTAAPTVDLGALNFVGDVLTIAVFDAETFDDIFGDMVDFNEEGTVARTGTPRKLCL
jgi:hypothetical protein